MAELIAKEEDLITADLESIPPERPDGPVGQRINSNLLHVRQTKM
jgi:hypothetical protein